MTTNTFTAKVKVAGQTREVTVQENGSGLYFLPDDEITFRHRTGQKTYGVLRAQVVKSHSGVFKPTTAWILRKVAFPCGWGKGTTVRSY